MLTPGFELSQDENFVSILIKARFAKISDTETFVDGKDFKFYSKPYFLRLNLPGSIIEDQRVTAKYDANTGWFTFRFPKETPGEHFDGLDMLTKLLAPRGQRSAAEPGIELLVDGESENPNEGEEEISWETEQKPYLEDESNLTGSVLYGFANRRSGVFERLQDELQNIVDVQDPDHTSLSERRCQRKLAERDQFDDEHYLADLFEDDMIQAILDYEPSWAKKTNGKDKRDTDKISSSNKEESFTEEEKEHMRRLPKKEYLLDKATEAEVYLGLVDLIYAYSYNARTTEEENSVESAWTICKLSSLLSWLDSFKSLLDVVKTNIRRSLCYPLYRNWQLALKVLDDVKMIFKLGRSFLLKCLLEIRSVLAGDDPHYILNDLYISDYCVWIQGASHSTIASLSDSLEKIKVCKAEVDLDLPELEAAAAEAIKEQNQEIDGKKNEVRLHGYPHALDEAVSKHDDTTENADLIAVLQETDSKSEAGKSETLISELADSDTQAEKQHETNPDFLNAELNSNTVSSGSAKGKRHIIQKPCSSCQMNTNDSSATNLKMACEETSVKQTEHKSKLDLSEKMNSLHIEDFAASSGTEDTDDDSSSSSDSDEDGTDSDDLSS